MGMMFRKNHHRHSKKVTRTKRWQVLRLAILERDGFRCKDCGCGGRLEVDHIQPVRTHPDLSFEPTNLQALCPTCHTKKTRLECGHKPMPPVVRAWGEAVAQLQRGTFRFGYSIPDGLKPSAVPVTLVCGPPGSGKTTMIRASAGPDDTIVDFDVFLKRAGGRKWDNDPLKVRAAFRMRDEALRALSSQKRGRAWVIATAPTEAERRAWKAALLRVTVVLLDVDAETCKARIRADPDRQHAIEIMCQSVDDWWTKHATDVACSTNELTKTSNGE